MYGKVFLHFMKKRQTIKLLDPQVLLKLNLHHYYYLFANNVHIIVVV